MKLSTFKKTVARVVFAVWLVVLAAPLAAPVSAATLSNAQLAMPMGELGHDPPIIS